MTALYIPACIHPSTISSPIDSFTAKDPGGLALAHMKHRHQLNQGKPVIYGD